MLVRSVPADGAEEDRETFKDRKRVSKSLLQREIHGMSVVEI